MTLWCSNCCEQRDHAPVSVGHYSCSECGTERVWGSEPEKPITKIYPKPRERSRRRKLTDEQVRELRALKGKKPQKDIARMFGLAECTVSEIINRKSYVEVEP